MNKLKKIIFFAALLPLLGAFRAQAFWPGEDRTFWDQAIEAANDAGKVLIRHGICERANRRCGGHVYTIGPMTGGFAFVISGIEDQKILEEVNDAVIKVFYKTPGIRHVLIEAYIGDGLVGREGPPKQKGLIHKFDLRRGE
ncbi:MAG: hypothetical protein K8R48_08220 [Alphaproteobacteria bacterium]|nr:hypothetical protein [Alphaproteobacteria bacterium]